MNSSDFIPSLFFKARAIIPDLPPLFVAPDLPPGSPDGEGKYENGQSSIALRSDFPSSALPIAEQAVLIENTVMHEAGHCYDGYLTALGHDHRERYWTWRGFPGSWANATAGADTMGDMGWQFQPRESWAECFGAAMSGQWTRPEKTFDFGRGSPDALAARSFFLSLAGGVNMGIVSSLGAEWHGPIPDTNYTAGRDVYDVDVIVLHTMVGWIAGADARFHKQGEQASAHYGLRLDGTLWQWVDERDAAYHAGNYDVNLRSIGIEHEDGGDYDGVRPDELYGASAMLVAELCRKYGVPCRRGSGGPGIYDHRQVSATACPDALDTDRIIAAAAKILGGGEDMAFKDDPDAVAYRQDVFDTFEAIKKVLADLSADDVADDQQVAEVTARIDKLKTI